MIRALLAHPQEALHKQHLVYCVRVISVGCTRIGVELVSPTPVPHQIYSISCFHTYSYLILNQDRQYERLIYLFILLDLWNKNQ
jgi:hypothetical protein